MAGPSPLFSGTPGNRQDLLSLRQNYPSPFFSLSDQYIPSTMKELYRWAVYAYTVNPHVYQTVRKMAGYVTTELVYSGAGNKSSSFEAWKNLMERKLKVKRMERMYLLDYFTYGAAYAMVMFPYERYLECPSCQSKHKLDNVDWEPQDLAFIAQCTKDGCDYKGEMKAQDRDVKSYNKLKLIRLNPRYIDPIYEDITDSYMYVYVIPKFVVARLKSQNPVVSKTYMSKIPLAVIDAVRKQENVKLEEDQIFHFKWDSLSRDDNSLGEVPLMPIFKYLWLFHTQWRAQEALAVENINPWLMVSPAAGTTIDPIKTYNLQRWRIEMQRNIVAWRRDPNHIALAPFPVNQVQLRGEYRNLNNMDSMNMIADMMTVGLGVTPSFLKGGASYSSASVELRVLENDFRNVTLLLDEFIDWLTNLLRRFYNLPAEKIHHQEFKMADDIQQKQTAMQAMQGGLISKETTVAELGYNAEVEEKKINEELKSENKKIKVQNLEQIKAQNEAARENFIMQTESMVVQQLAQEKLTAGEVPDIRALFEQVGRNEHKKIAPGSVDVSEIDMEPQEQGLSPEQVDIRARAFLRGRASPTLRENELILMEANNATPEAKLTARRIRELMREMKQQAANTAALTPAKQKPGKRSAGTAVE